MIKGNKSLSMPEARIFVKDIERNEELIKFMEGFTKLKPKEAQEIRMEIENLGMMKLRAEHITKVIELMPETTEDLNKIFSNVSLTEDETKNILDTVKKYK